MNIANHLCFKIFNFVVFVLGLGCKATILRWEPQAVLGRRNVCKWLGEGAGCRSLIKKISQASVCVPGLAFSKLGGCCSDGFYVPTKRKEGKKPTTVRAICMLQRKGLFCVLFVSNLFRSFTVSCVEEMNF